MKPPTTTLHSIPDPDENPFAHLFSSQANEDSESAASESNKPEAEQQLSIDDLMFQRFNNPFGVCQLAFFVKAYHRTSGHKANGVIPLNVPAYVTEHQARRLILRMAHAKNWIVKSIDRIPDEEDAIL